MFKYTVEYLTCFGAMTINTNYFKCRAFSKIGAWQKFLGATAGEDHYSCRDHRYNFLRMRHDIKRGWHNDRT
jgi:hypothetical protein